MLSRNPLRALALTLPAAVVMACGGSGDAPQAAIDKSADSAAAPTTAAPTVEAAVPPPPASGYEVLGAGLDAAPAGVQVTGKVVDGFRWRDQSGENLVLLTETGEFRAGPSGYCLDACRDGEVYAYHFVKHGAAWEQLWRVTDFIRGCDLDLKADFVKGSLGVTDLDADGIAESTFQYTLACRGGVDPGVRKLIMHEGATKYAIRGSTDISDIVGKEYGGGERNVDPAFDRAPAALRAHALAQWQEFITKGDMGDP